MAYILFSLSRARPLFVNGFIYRKFGQRYYNDQAPRIFRGKRRIKAIRHTQYKMVIKEKLYIWI